MKMKEPKPDPALVAQQQRAQNDRIASLQDNVSSQTLDLFRRFGSMGSPSPGMSLFKGIY